MEPLFFFAYVEDKPSKEILIKLVEKHNQAGGRPIAFLPGFPEIKNGFGNIKKQCPAFLKMADSGLYTLLLTDLDAAECPAALIEDWFFSGRSDRLPKQVVFRVAVREVEAWLMADKAAFAKFLGLPQTEFDDDPETLTDPKGFLLCAIDRKAEKQWVREMLPTGSASIGPEYNNTLCRFIEKKWSIDRACKKAPSLQRAVTALGRV